MTREPGEAADEVYCVECQRIRRHWWHDMVTYPSHPNRHKFNPGKQYPPDVAPATAAPAVQDIPAAPGISGPGVMSTAPGGSGEPGTTSPPAVDGDAVLEEFIGMLEGQGPFDGGRVDRPYVMSLQYAREVKRQRALLAALHVPSMHTGVSAAETIHELQQLNTTLRAELAALRTPTMHTGTSPAEMVDALGAEVRAQRAALVESQHRLQQEQDEVARLREEVERGHRLRSKIEAVVSAGFVVQKEQDELLAIYVEALERIAVDYDHAKGFCGWCDVTAEGHEHGCPAGIAREAIEQGKTTTPSGSKL